MLVAVTQRTREIGIIKILGATRRSILLQFLLEAMTIVTAGGLLGVLLGFCITKIVGSLPLLGPLFKDTSGAGDIHLSISAFACLPPLLLLEMVGLISGFLPAFALPDWIRSKPYATNSRRRPVFCAGTQERAR